MQKLFSSIWSILPGLVLALGLAAVAKFLESLLPIHVIGASVIALLWNGVWVLFNSAHAYSPCDPTG